jgi:flavin reductase (DIM6/NTAB) family NADH-FMN oxidoreductase RutF
MAIINSERIVSWDRFYRTNFINCLTGFKPVSLIGTVNREGLTNLGVFSNIVHIGADPALVGYINRPRTASPHTLKNIESSGVYTINHIHAEILERAHMTSAKYPDNVSEFDAVGLSAEYLNGITAPFVKESNVKFALELREIIPISINDTFMVIGQIMAVFLDDTIISDDGYLDLEKAGSVCSNGIDGYYSPHKINRYKYSKP